jgi:hypothetical protein
MGIFMNYAAEIELGAMIYIPNFIKIDSGIKKLIGVIHTHTHTHTHTRRRFHKSTARPPLEAVTRKLVKT